VSIYQVGLCCGAVQAHPQVAMAKHLETIAGNDRLMPAIRLPGSVLLKWRRVDTNRLAYLTGIQCPIVIVKYAKFCDPVKESVWIHGIYASNNNVVNLFWGAGHKHHAIQTLHCLATSRKATAALSSPWTRTMLGVRHYCCTRPVHASGYKAGSFSPSTQLIWIS